MSDKKQSARTMSPENNSTQPSQAVKQKRNKALVIAAIVVAVVAVVAGVIYFFSVRQNPGNIVMNAVVNTVEAKNLQSSGTIETTLERFNGKLNIEFNSAKADKDSRMDAKVSYQSDKIKKPVKTDGQVILGSDGTIYLKMSNVKGVVSTAFTEIESVYDQVQLKGSKAYTFSPGKLILNASEFLNDKWIKLPPGQASSDSSLNPFACLQGVVAKYNANSSERRAIIKAYRANDFILIHKDDLKDKENSDGYRISFDKDEFKSFEKAIQKTSIGKMTAKCSEDSSSSNKTDQDFLEGHIDLWINKYSHQITHLNYDNNPLTKLDIKLDYSNKTEVNIPAEAKTIEEIFSKPNLEAEAKKK